MEVALKIADVLRGFVKHSGSMVQVLIDQETIDDLDAEIDQAEADEAFREVIKELCLQYGMAPNDKPYFYIKRKLAQRNEPDLRLICDLAKVCADNGIQEGEDPASFIESKCREVLRLTDELESTQHKLADAVSDAESDYDQDDCVAECLARDDIAKQFTNAIHINIKQHETTRKFLLATFIIAFATLVASVL